MRIPPVSLLLVSTLAAAAPSRSGADITFYKDVLPVVQKNCQNCHRPGEAAPISFLSYRETRPYAAAMKEAVLSRKMPPWFADPHVGKFTNDRSLAKTDIDTIVAWANSGGKEGDPKDAPAPAEFVSGWIIGKPDAIFELPEAYSVPSSGTIEYTYAIVPTNFTEDKWVTMAEARPDNRALVHHIIAFVREPGSHWFADYPKNKMFVPNKKGGGGEGGGQFMTGYAPGLPPESLRPGQAKLIKAGSDIVFQMHYTATGKAGIDRSRAGVIFAKEPPTHRVLTLAASNGKFVIPPGASDYSAEGEFTLQADSELQGLLPHMHLRGKSMEIRAIYPNGEVEKLLWVPHYDFNWQLWYQLPLGKKLPKGTRIRATGSFDNSANNKANPNPNAEVRYGDQSWEEMMIGFFDVSIPVEMDPSNLWKAPKKLEPKPSATGGGE